jgi:hypothetical protein
MLNSAVYDLERFGLRFVASPRHADVLLVTGPVTHNMREALERTYRATPDPKWVLAWVTAPKMGAASPAAPPSLVLCRTWFRSICRSAVVRRHRPRFSKHCSCSSSR